MKILVVYATRYGATRGIAERIAHTLNESGHSAAAVPVSNTGPLAGYDAYVIGSAAYMFSWLKEATNFVRRNTQLLQSKPVWIFSSGPLGTEPKDPNGRDMQETTVPKEFAELKVDIHPVGQHVFFGAFDHTKLNMRDRLVYAMPAIKKLMPEGDFRDWDDVDAWTSEIAARLVPAAVS